MFNENKSAKIEVRVTKSLKKRLQAKFPNLSEIIRGYLEQLASK
jgi:hypothetical protein